MAAKILACNDPLGIRQHCYQHEAGLHQKRWKANGVDLISDPVTVMESGVVLVSGGASALASV